MTDQVPSDIAPQARRKTSLWTWLVFLLLVALALWYPGGLTRFFREPASPAIGRHLPQLELEPLTGDSDPVRLTDVSGQVVLLNFWGTWCPPCQEEFPHLVDLGRDFHDRPGFRMLLTSCSGDSDDNDLAKLRGETEEFLKKHEANVPTYADPGAVTRRAVMMVAGEDFAYPTTLALDGHGVIRGIWVGYTPAYAAEMKATIERLLSDVRRKSND